jgi:adenylate cyclase
MGDGLLAEFPSVIDAVKWAVEFQAMVAELSAEEPGDQRIEYRVGVNLGDVIIDGDDIFGDGVNVAARLQEIAAPGGVCISEKVQTEVRGKIDVEFIDGAAQALKNISEPLSVWRWSPGPIEADEAAPPPPAGAPLAVPDRPSIAVLPFQNMSGDPEQEFFADGMTEDIITGLSRFRSLFVIARNSTFAYKGQSPDVRDVASDLGVRYVLEGSVRRAGARIRITGQLIDAETGNHLWAERYDRDLAEFFAVQDEVTEVIVGAIAPEISDVERDRAQRKPPDNFDAWGLYQRGLAAYYSSTEEGQSSAIELFDKANEIDPTFAPAFAMASTARTRHMMHFMPGNRDEILNQARLKSHKAITLDPRDSLCLWNDGRVHSLLGLHDVAILKVEEAVALNPNDAMSRYILSAVLCSAGRAEDAIPHVDHAIRLSPRDIFFTGMLFHRALMLFHLARYEEAFDWARRSSLSPNPRPLTFALLTATLTRLDRREEAQTALADLLAHAPGASCAKFQDNPMFGGADVLSRFIDALRAAGLPE